MLETSREKTFNDVVEARGLCPPRLGYLNRTLRGLTAFFAAAFLRNDVAGRSGLVQRVHPLARLLALFIFLASVSLATSIAALGAHALLVLAAISCARIRPREILGGGLLIAAVFSLLMALPATLNVISGGAVVWPLLRLDASWQAAPYRLPAVIGLSPNGVHAAASFVIRTVVSTAAVLCLALATRWTDLLAALRSLRLPALFLQTFGMTMRYLHVLLRQTEDTHMARKSRVCCRQPLAVDHTWVGSRIAAAWEKNLHLMDEVSEAMTARGFTGETRAARARPLRASDWTSLLLIVVLCVGAHHV